MFTVAFCHLALSLYKALPGVEKGPELGNKVVFYVSERSANALTPGDLYPNFMLSFCITKTVFYILKTTWEDKCHTNYSHSLFFNRALNLGAMAF